MNRHFLFAIAAPAVLLAITGCGTIDAANREPLLSAAGFVARTPETAKQRELYAAAPAYHVERIEVEGKVYYAYKDEKKGIAFIGDEAAYQRYQKLAIQQRIARDNYEAAQMNRDASYGWYSGYSLKDYGTGRVVLMR